MDIFSVLSGDLQRPFPQDIEMRCGLLGELTSGIKPHPPKVAREGLGLLPPEKKLALANSLPGPSSKEPTCGLHVCSNSNSLQRANLWVACV